MAQWALRIACDALILNKSTTPDTPMPETYQFIGNINTFIGAGALFATPILLYWIFRSYWKSPYRK